MESCESEFSTDVILKRILHARYLFCFPPVWIRDRLLEKASVLVAEKLENSRIQPDRPGIQEYDTGMWKE